MELIHCDESRLETIRAIFNHAIVHSTALYDYQPRSPEQIRAWFARRKEQGRPVLGVVGKAGRLLGFGSYGTFRNFPAYKYTVEHSLYVVADARRQGAGRMLLEALVANARQQDVHAMVGAIDADNAASIALHETLGFRHLGTLPEVGYKFGRWLDLALYQRTLSTPADPRED